MLYKPVIWSIAFANYILIFFLIFHYRDKWIVWECLEFSHSNLLRWIMLYFIHSDALWYPSNYDLLRWILCLITLTCYLSMKHFTCCASPAVLHLLCVESYVLMCPFYYSNYQSILFCVQSVIKFLSHNDVCVCLSIVLYLLIPHSYNPHLTSYSYLSFLFYSGSARWGDYDRY